MDDTGSVESALLTSEYCSSCGNRLHRIYKDGTEIHHRCFHCGNVEDAPYRPSPPRRVALSSVVGSIQTLNPGQTVEIVNDTEATCTVWCGRGEFAETMGKRSGITIDNGSTRIAELEQERATFIRIFRASVTAICDAVRRPMGVEPESADIALRAIKRVLDQEDDRAEGEAP